MKAYYELTHDPEGEHLAVARSTVGVSAHPAGHPELFRFDYERDKGGGYPEAHIQVTGESPDLAAALARRDRRVSLGKLHFPVGGRRYRPSLEDVIEFLVVEGFVEPRPGWREVVERSRGQFQRLQLSAAVRRDPDAADRALRALAS